jgi:hypothetical protein
MLGSVACQINLNRDLQYQLERPLDAWMDLCLTLAMDRCCEEVLFVDCSCNSVCKRL